MRVNKIKKGVSWMLKIYNNFNHFVMKKYIIALCLSLFSLVAVQAQNQLEELVKEGIAFHDNGQYEKAIERYLEMFEVRSKFQYCTL